MTFFSFFSHRPLLHGHVRYILPPTTFLACECEAVTHAIVIDVCPSVCPSVCLSNACIVTKRKHPAKKVQLESVQLRKHCISKATPTSRQSIWHSISIFCVFLFENIAFWEVPPRNHKYRIAYLILTRGVASRPL